MSKAYDVVRDFEQAVAKYTGAPHAIAVESCSSAIFLCCFFNKVHEFKEIVIPNKTYPSVPASVVHAGGRIKFVGLDWQGWGAYYLLPTKIVDSAKCLSRGMYEPGDYQCLSFHGKKCLAIGRGGMILTDNEEADRWFRAARFDGRHEVPLHTDILAFPGWNMYMTPEQASRGMELMQWIKEENIGEYDEYQDLSKYSFYTEANRE